MRQEKRKISIKERLNLSKFAGILGEFAATERRELEVDTSREVSSETFCCDQERARSSKVEDKPEKFRLYTTNRSFGLGVESRGRGTCVSPESKQRAKQLRKNQPFSVINFTWYDSL